MGEFKKMFCNKCGQELPKDANSCPYCGQIIDRSSYNQTRAPQAIQQSSETHTQAQLQKAGPTYPCPRCGSTAPKEKAYKTWIQIICCLLGIVVGVVYYMLRHNSVKCLECGKVF